MAMYLLDDIALHRYTFQSIFLKLPFSENKLSKSRYWLNLQCNVGTGHVY